MKRILNNANCIVNIMRLICPNAYLSSWNSAGFFLPFGRPQDQLDKGCQSYQMIRSRVGIKIKFMLNESAPYLAAQPGQVPASLDKGPCMLVPDPARGSVLCQTSDSHHEDVSSDVGQGQWKHVMSWNSSRITLNCSAVVVVWCLMPYKVSTFWHWTIKQFVPHT